MDPIALAVISVIVGFAVGILSGMLGIGGGTILVPVFKLGFGLAPLACTATSLFTIIPTSISGAITHIRGRTCIFRVGLAAGIGGAVTSPLGVWLASVSPDWATMVAAAAVIAYSAYTMLRKALKMGKGNPAAAGAQTMVAAKPGARTVALAAVIGLVAGVLSGYVGVGGGFIMVPLFMQLLGLPMKKTSGTSLIAVMILAVPGVITQAIMGNVNWVAGIFVAAGSIPGAVIGSHLMKRVPERTLRFIFSAFLFVAAAMLILDQVGII